MHFKVFWTIKKKQKKTSKIWVDQGSKVCNKFFKKLLKGNNIEMYSTHNEGKSVVAQKFKKNFKK